MGKLQCDVCGSSILIRPDGQSGECTCCGAVYPIARLRAMAGAAAPSAAARPVQPASRLEDLRVLAEQHYASGCFQECLDVVNKMLEINPRNSYALDKYEELQTLKYMTVKNGVLTKYTGKASELKIPSCVVAIGIQAFLECSSLVKVQLPDSVTEIGSSAFVCCVDLASINIPDSVTEIGGYAFHGCGSLTSIHIPGGVTEINGGAFRGCGSLTSINIPDGVTEIGISAFDGCIALTSINIPDSVTKIGSSAFGWCRSLTSIHIPCGVTEIGKDAFCGCTSLTNVASNGSFSVNLQFAEKYCRDTPLLAQMRMQENRCRYCGGEFQGFLSRVCRRCGKRKDY